MTRTALEAARLATGSLDRRYVSSTSWQEAVFRKKQTIFDDVQHVAHRSNGGLRIVAR